MKRDKATKWMDGAAQVLIGATAAAAACIALTGAGFGAGAGEPANAQAALYRAAMASYEARQWPQAYEQLAAAADGGERSAARVAAMMVRQGPLLFGHRFEASPERLARWERADDEAAPATSRETGARTTGSPPGVQVARAR